MKDEQVVGVDATVRKGEICLQERRAVSAYFPLQSNHLVVPRLLLTLQSLELTNELCAHRSSEGKLHFAACEHVHHVATQPNATRLPLGDAHDQSGVLIFGAGHAYA